MPPETTLDPNLEQAVPFLAVASMASSLRFYVSGLGFEVKHRWDDGGKLRWCWLARGGAALMLQEFAKEGHDAFVPGGKVGVGVRITFVCRDALALFRELGGRGLSPARPFVGNGMWVTSLVDPDGYRLEFESPTGAPEDTRYEGASG
jgi:catechol 2,3-dioxygenase-like lactoylglutathione lyase family enzyme